MNVTKAHFIISVILTGTLCAPAWASEDPNSIEVFTDSVLQVVNSAQNTTVYVIDRIDQLQQELSNDLSNDPEKAKQLASQRFQRMNAQLSSELENAAKGLGRAMQYGIDRYPAVVFDGQAVVYGVTDIDVATGHYRRWRGQANP